MIRVSEFGQGLAFKFYELGTSDTCNVSGRLAV